MKNLDALKYIQRGLENIYISPTEICNLNCKMCYTNKTNKSILDLNTLKQFILKYKKYINLQTITLTGGEIFLIKNIENFINFLTQQNIIVQIITNGTILDKLFLLKKTDFINIIVSIDGFKEYHEKNRGKGTFLKSINFIKTAHKLGFHTQIFSIVTKQNFKNIENFEKYLKKTLYNDIDITYHPRKNLLYLNMHPVDNIKGQIKGFDFLDKDQLIYLYKNKQVFPPNDFTCAQISIKSDGFIYGCCEGFTKIGSIKDDIQKIKKTFIKTLIYNITNNKTFCFEPNFKCGYA